MVAPDWLRSSADQWVSRLCWCVIKSETHVFKLQRNMQLHKYTTNQAKWPTSIFVTISSLIITLLQKKKFISRAWEQEALLKNNIKPFSRPA